MGHLSKPETTITMKMNFQLTLAMIASVAILLPISAFADDQMKQGQQQGKGRRHREQAVQQGGGPASAPSGRIAQGAIVHNAGKVNNASSGLGHVSHVINRSATVQPSNVSQAASRSAQQGSRTARVQRNQTQVYSQQQRASIGNNGRTGAQRGNREQNQAQFYSSQQYNRGNNYGGLWFAADTHRDWDRNGEHRWNRHNYRWYDGGWLIIDGGYSPSITMTGGSTARNVQIRLADQGYYHGPIDGDVGPETRNAIADYQSEHDLRVTGRINDPLLESLRM
jgi:hypothetical protein